SLSALLLSIWGLANGRGCTATAWGRIATCSHILVCVQLPVKPLQHRIRTYAVERRHTAPINRMIECPPVLASIVPAQNGLAGPATARDGEGLLELVIPQAVSDDGGDVQS